jgi:MATE family multidrug resistance protein
MALRSELRALFELAWPATVTQVGLMLTGVVDTMVAARIGSAELAAAALGHMWMWSTMSIGMGVVLGTDPMISQAHGRGDGEGAALGVQRGIVVAVLISVPVCVAMALTAQALRLLGEPAAVAALAGRYNLLRVPMVPCFLVFSALRVFLQARGRMGPATTLVYVANVLNAVIAWALTFGHWGAPRLGFDGAALAGSFTCVFELVALLALIQWLGLARGAQRVWDGASFSLAGIGAVLRIGGPIGLQFWLEGFAFTFAAFMAGWISVDAIGAHQIAINLASLSFMVPLGVSMGASARVGNLIGAGDAPSMRRAIGAALAVGVGVMSFSALAFLFLRAELPRLYTDDAAVIAAAAQVLPLAGAFQLSDGAQVVAGGVLRGMGRPHAAAIANLVGYYALGLPLGYALAFRYELGLRGIWFGLIAGLLTVSASLLVWVRRTALRPLAELTVDAV